MKPITREWISKAEGDWAAANLLFRARRITNYDATCFHAQQCAEKYLKARLEEAGVASGKTHDLAKLLSLVLPVEPSWSVLRQDLIVLTDFAVDYRYPGSSATKADAKDVYVAEVPELPGCMAHGDTHELALAKSNEAIQLWIDTANEFGDPVPEPRGQRLMQA